MSGVRSSASEGARGRCPTGTSGPEAINWMERARLCRSGWDGNQSSWMTRFFWSYSTGTTVSSSPAAMPNQLARRAASAPDAPTLKSIG